MKQLFTFIICILLVQVVKADLLNPNLPAVTRADTNLLVNIAPPVVSPFQNVIYKRRLDSIQKEVQLDYNEYVQSYIDNYTARRDEMGRMLGLTRYYFPIYEKAFRDVGIPDEIKYLSIVESALNPNAMSRVGAAGPWQFMSETAKIYGLKMNEYVDERRDPVQASYAAAAYLKDAYQQFGDWLLAIASYNCGKSNVEHALEKTGTHDYWSIRELLPPETRGYVPAFIAVNYVMKFHNRHNILAQNGDLAIATDTMQVNKFVPLSRIATALGMSFKDLCVLNPAYRQQIVNGSAAAPRMIIIPQIDKQREAVLRAAIDNLNAPIQAMGPIHYVPLPQPVELAFPSKPVYAQANSAAGQPVVTGPAPAYYTTQKGDTLSDIAGKYGIKIADLLQWNKELGSNTTLSLMPGLSVKLGKG
ncbi:LysM peptidoglycan-binding domain-containing protein [Inquilinus sp. KBS0705]|nr:LysM peptidoglycan-binding domain-containing protein [Inquilinus sp. KBS0705]